MLILCCLTLYVIFETWNAIIILWPSWIILYFFLEYLKIFFIFKSLKSNCFIRIEATNSGGQLSVQRLSSHAPLQQPGRGSWVQIPGADLLVTHQAMLWQCPAYKIEEDWLGTDVSSGTILLTKEKKKTKEGRSSSCKFETQLWTRCLTEWNNSTQHCKPHLLMKEMRIFAVQFINGNVQHTTPVIMCNSCGFVKWVGTFHNIKYRTIQMTNLNQRGCTWHVTVEISMIFYLDRLSKTPIFCSVMCRFKLHWR